MSWCFSRLFRFLWSRLKETLADACVAANSFTGIETSPNEMVAPAIALAMVCASVLPGRIRCQIFDNGSPSRSSSHHHLSEGIGKGRAGAFGLVLEEHERLVEALFSEAFGPASQRRLAVVLAAQARGSPRTRART